MISLLLILKTYIIRFLHKKMEFNKLKLTVKHIEILSKLFKMRDKVLKIFMKQINQLIIAEFLNKIKLNLLYQNSLKDQLKDYLKIPMLLELNL